MKKILPVSIVLLLIIALVSFLLLKQTVVGVKDCPEPTCAAPTSTTTNTTIIIATSTGTTTDIGTGDLKTFSDTKQKVSFDYRENFYLNNNLTQYVHPVEWPPQIVVATEKFTCDATNKNNILKKINGTNYCLTVEAEGAAGSTYTTYTYKKAYDAKIVSLTFIVRVPQCDNYEEPNTTNCKTEIKNFSIDNLIDGVFKSVKFN